MESKQFSASKFDATRVLLYAGVPRDFQRHLVSAAAIWFATGSDIERCFTNSPYVSDENALKTRIFCKIKTFHIYFCPLLKLFKTFCYPGYSPEK